MRKHLGVGVSCLLLFSAVIPAVAQAAAKPPAQAASEQAVLDLEHSLLQARVTTSTAVHRSSFAQEGIYIHSSGWAQNRNEVLDMVEKARWAQWNNREEEVHLYGDLAVTHSLLTVLLTDKRTETVRTTGVYVKRSGAWRQVSWQSSIGRFVGP
jgi:hypothetical protein